MKRAVLMCLCLSGPAFGATLRPFVSLSDTVVRLSDLFEHAVDVVPERPVLRVGDKVVTYSELESEANRLAHYLAARGIGPGDHVGIYSKNSFEHVVALLAIFKVRAVAINVNYRYLEREDGRYRTAGQAPERAAIERQEIPAWEAHWLQGFLDGR